MFFVRIDVYDRDGKAMQDDYVFAIGFSAISFVALTLCFYVLVGSVVWTE
jgi:hypothetical protein